MTLQDIIKYRYTLSAIPGDKHLLAEKVEELISSLK
jgi:hypothetical protein